MLNPNAQKWVDALRSGKYVQGQSCLRKTVEGVSTFCCLGVACDVYAQEVGGSWGPMDQRRDVKFTDPEKSVASGFLTPAVTKWLGLLWIDGRNVKHSLSRLNDFDHFTFTQIADFIESQPEGLFEPPATS